MRAHLEWARGTDAENNAYCSKDGDIWLHIGHPAGGTGGRGGNHMYDTACEIATMLANKESILDILAKGDTYVSSYFWHARVIQELAEAESHDRGLAVASDLLRDPVLKKWQHDLLLQLEGDSDPRKIIWYTDGQGDSRKTFISRYLVVKKNAFRLENYKSADLKYAYDGQPIVIFDLTRSMQEHFIVVVVGCHRWDTHACATCGQMYRREGWLSRHYETGPRIH